MHKCIFGILFCIHLDENVRVENVLINRMELFRAFYLKLQLAAALQCYVGKGKEEGRGKESTRQAGKEKEREGEKEQRGEKKGRKRGEKKGNGKENTKGG